MLCRRGQSVPSAALYSQCKLRRGLARLIPYGANPLNISGITQGNSLRQIIREDSWRPAAFISQVLLIRIGTQ